MGARAAIIFLAIVAVPGLLCAQDCVEVLNTAENEFVAGRFYSVPAILKDCLDRNAYSNEQKVRVYLLLTQVYLLTDQPAEADNSYLKLLEADPEYIATQEKDPVEVYFLSKKFTTTPIFTPHFKGGLTVTRPVIIRDNSLFGNESLVSRSETSRLGWTLGSGIEWNINDHLGLGGELYFTLRQFGINYAGGFGDDILETTEKQYWIDLPLYLRYGKALGKFRPYGYVGHSFNFLLNTQLATTYTDSNGDAAAEQVIVEGADLDITYNRRVINRSVFAGAGLKVKTGKNFLLFDARYSVGFTNISKGSYYAEGSNELAPGIPRYTAHSNDLRVESLLITIGYVRPLYDPRRIKAKKGKSLN